MSRQIIRGIGCLASTILLTSATLAHGQPGATGRAPVPRQLLDARAVFIGNGGSETYGADTYYRLTRYDGGPNRAYNSFFHAVKQWGHYELVDSIRDADVVFVIRFANPVVDQTEAASRRDPTQYPIYDPQLDLAINDPRTGLPIWTITEHIEPGDDRDADNRHFDEAITRLVGDLQILIFAPSDSVTIANTIPPGAVRVEIRRRRTMHAGIGGLVGGLVGGFAASRTAQYACNDNFTMLPVQQPPFFPNTQLPALPPPPDFSCDVNRERTRFRNELIGSIGGTLIGALVGWVWPVSF